VDSYLNPSLHGRQVAPRFTADGPEQIDSRRVMDLPDAPECQPR